MLDEIEVIEGHEALADYERMSAAVGRIAPEETSRLIRKWQRFANAGIRRKADPEGQKLTMLAMGLPID